MTKPETEKLPLSSRLRPNIECAPWVIEEVRKLEDALRAQGGGESKSCTFAHGNDWPCSVCGTPRKATPDAAPDAVGWIHEVVWVDGVNRTLHWKEPTPLKNPLAGFVSQRIFPVAEIAHARSAGGEGHE